MSTLFFPVAMRTDSFVDTHAPSGHRLERRERRKKGKKGKEGTGTELLELSHLLPKVHHCRDRLYGVREEEHTEVIGGRISTSVGWGCCQEAAPSALKMGTSYSSSLLSDVMSRNPSA